MRVGSQVYEPKVLRSMQMVGLIVSTVPLLYVLIISLSYGSSDIYLDDAVLYGLFGLWLIFSLIQFTREDYTPKQIIAVLVVHHLFAIAIMTLGVGFTAPVVCCWAFLYFMSYIFFSSRGLQLSIASIYGAWLLYVVAGGISLSAAAISAITLAIGVAVALTAISLSALQAGDRKKLEQSQARAERQQEALSTIINSTTQAIVTVSSTGKIQLYNSAFLGLIDTNKTLDNTAIDSVLALRDAEGNEVSLLDIMKSNHHFERDDLMIKVDANDTMRLHINGNTIQSSYSDVSKHKDEYVCILRDITKEKSLEEERDEFISVISHELRTPIAIAEGTISNALLMLDRKDVPEAKTKQGVKLAYDQVRFLATMVNDLSTLSRAERGVGDEVEEINVAQLLQKLYQQYAPQAQEKGLQLNLDVVQSIGTVTTSRLYLEELLQNFITNAIKYTKEGTVRLWAKKEGKAIVLGVKDSGIGISKSDQAKIFNKFYRSEDYRTRETGGTGLGLYVAAKLARKLGTKIEVTSRLNHGSTFSIALQRREKG